MTELSGNGHNKKPLKRPDLERLGSKIWNLKFGRINAALDADRRRRAGAGPAQKAATLHKNRVGYVLSRLGGSAARGALACAGSAALRRTGGQGAAGIQAVAAIRCDRYTDIGRSV